MAVHAVCPHCKTQFELCMDAVPGRDYLCPQCRKTFRVAVGSALALSLRREQALTGVVFRCDPCWPTTLWRIATVC